MINDARGALPTVVSRFRYRSVVFVLLSISLAPVWMFLDQPPARGQVPIKNISRWDGVRENQLKGFGVVVGLAGTGDGQIDFVNRSLANALSRLGVRVQEPSDARLDNIAAVMVTATLPAFRRPGDEIDVVVSSIGSADDLSGGVLIQTPLSAANEKVYAVAQGPITKGGGEDDRHLTTVRIPRGALVEREVPFEFVDDQKQVYLQLMRGDFTTSNRVARVVNEHFEGTLARPQNATTVAIRVPEAYVANPVKFLSRVENLTVTPGHRARIVINERTGTILMGEDVSVRPVSISHRGLTIQVGPSGTDGPSDGSLKLPQYVTIGDVTKSLNAAGASTSDIVAILEAMDRSGALSAPLEVM